ncbi:hypothetical protein [Salinigranum halophilum]|uniref:hypothetical protein n=1 Tax=Salinigranum halophilum TaxID=2565931 RepID=UPI0010A89380|nr:hypothetical protein [Salinigranum halophilum]
MNRVDRVVLWTAWWPAVLAALLGLGAAGAPEAVLYPLAGAMWAMVLAGALACAVSMWRSRRSSLWILSLVFTMPAHIFWAHQVWSGST